MIDKEEAIKIIERHLAMLPNYDIHTENNLEDKVEEGYGNACLNILREIERA